MPLFPRDRYDSVRLLAAFDKVNPCENHGQISSTFRYCGEDFEIYFPTCECVPIPEDISRLARQACLDICELDNLVQDSCDKDARESDFAERNFQVEIAYISVFDDRIHIRYWGTIVNVELEVKFIWNESLSSWSPLNL